MYYVDGVMYQEAEVEEVVKKGVGHVVGVSQRAEDLILQSTKPTDVALMALNELLGHKPQKEVVEVTKELLASIKDNINKDALKYRAYGRGQTSDRKEVPQTKRIIGYDRHGLAILK
jgi:hypothetical protein